MSEKLLTVSSSPHVRGKQTTRSIMTDVIIALAPASILAVVIFGLKALLLIVVCVASCVASEALTQKILKKKCSISDMSAALTGLLLALNLPIGAPWWVAVIGSVMAIVLVKQIFGGIGNNFLNPALAARVMLVTSWPIHMAGGAYIPTDATASATPLALPLATDSAAVAAGATEFAPSVMEMFLGFPGVYGSIGEISALALIIGGIYLVYRKVISLRIPLVYIGTVAIFCFLAGENVLFHLCAGGLMLGAIFMATDYVTSPASPLGQIIYAVGCGVVTCVIRLYGAYPEGVSFSILFMNVFTPLIDKFIKIKKYGAVKK